MNEARLPAEMRLVGYKSPGAKATRAAKRAGKMLWYSCELEFEGGAWVKKLALGTYVRPGEK